MVVSSFVCCSADSCAGRSDERLRVLGRDEYTTHGAAQDQDCVREERRGPEDRGEHLVLHREDAGPTGEATDHRRGAATTVGRTAARPRHHTQGCK